MFYVCQSDGYSSASVKDTTDGSVETYSHGDIVNLVKQGINIAGVLDSCVATVPENELHLWYSGDYMGAPDYDSIVLVGDTKLYYKRSDTHYMYATMYVMNPVVRTSMRRKYTSVRGSHIVLGNYFYSGFYYGVSTSEHYIPDYEISAAFKDRYNHGIIIGRPELQGDFCLPYEMPNPYTGVQHFDSLYFHTDTRGIYLNRAWYQRDSSGRSGLYIDYLQGVNSTNEASTFLKAMCETVESVYEKVKSGSLNLLGVSVSGDKLMLNGLDGKWVIDMPTVYKSYNKVLGTKSKMETAAQRFGSGSIQRVYDNGVLDVAMVNNGKIILSDSVTDVPNNSIKVPQGETVEYIKFGSNIKTCGTNVVDGYIRTWNHRVLIDTDMQNVKFLKRFIKALSIERPIDADYVFTDENASTLLQFLFLSVDKYVWSRISQVFQRIRDKTENYPVTAKHWYDAISTICNKHFNNLSFMDAPIQFKSTSKRLSAYANERQVSSLFHFDMNYRKILILGCIIEGYHEDGHSIRISDSNFGYKLDVLIENLTDKFEEYKAKLIRAAIAHG